MDYATLLRTLPSDWVLPDWSGKCMAHIPGTLEKVLTGATQRSHLTPSVLPNGATHFDRVVLFLVDAFGWRFLESHLQSQLPAFWKTLEQEATITKLTSLFPSTTSGCIPTLHYGRPPGETGLYEWYSYDPIVDKIICPFFFSVAAGKKVRNSLQTLGYTKEQIFLQQSLYQDLAEKGVPSFLFQSKEFTPSPFSDSAFVGADVFPFENIQTGLSQLVASYTNGPRQGYWYFYIDTFDTVSHNKGPGSVELLSEAKSIFSEIEKAIVALRKVPANSLIIITADHGHIEMDPENTIFLDKEIPHARKFIKRNSQGELLAPAGSGRDLFLSIEPDMLAEAHFFLSESLEGKALVFRTEELIEAGVFGKNVSQRLTDRIGNLVILTLDSSAVWWSEHGQFNYQKLGDHGGLTPSEMDIPFMALSL